MDDTLLKNPRRAGLYYLSPHRQAALRQHLAHSGLKALAADLSKARSIEEALDELGKALELPDWYGSNFDALADCLADPDWMPAKGHVILIRGISELRDVAAASLPTLIDVFRSAAEARRADGTPFWILLDTPVRGVSPCPEA